MKTKLRSALLAAGGLALGITLTATAAPTLDDLLDLERPTPALSEPTQPDAPALNPDAAEALAAEEMADLFAQAVGQMGGIAERLGPRRDPGLETQRMQESVLAKLDKLIDQVRQQGGQGKPEGQPQEQDQGDPGNAQPQPAGAQQGGMTANPGTPPGAGGIAQHDEGQPIEQQRREWGNLPQRIRSELLQGLGEPFSPVYRAMTERYYRRLAEEE